MGQGRRAGEDGSAMFHSRRINKDTHAIEVWECEWSDPAKGMAKKVFLHRIGNEDDLDLPPMSFNLADVVCWAPGRTIGNIAVNSEAVRGVFVGSRGDDAILPCQIVRAGLFRNGKKRWYCKTHQVHWGTTADYAAVDEAGDIVCSNHAIRMSYVVDPLEVSFSDFEEIGIWCSLPPALSSDHIERRPPRIHVHKRFAGESEKLIDADFDAIVCAYGEQMALFANAEITRIQVTPPAAFEFVYALEEDKGMSCILCNKCGFPHLDLGSFAQTPHRKHFCGNCGNDSIWSKEAIASTPLKPLHDQFSNSNEYVTPERHLNLDAHVGSRFEVWASTPAVLWTAHRAQEKGIHVHVYGGPGEDDVVNDTFGTVTYGGQLLDRRELWRTMVRNTIY
jgi:hypothetical protein